MKKLGLILKLLVVIAAVAAGVYFARIREVYSGTVVVDDHRGTPIAGVKVRLYKLADVERWTNNDFVASFLHWKDREEELRLLQEMYGKHENLLGSKKPAINSKLGKYKADKSLGFTSVEFPDKLFRQIRLDLPSDLYDPAKSLFYHRKADEQDLTKQIFFNKLKKEFPDINSHNFQQIQNKFDAEDWDQQIGYKPEYSQEQAERAFHQFGQLDVLAAKLQQFALNDRQVQHLAPHPLMEETTGADGRVSFAIDRFSKKYAVDSKIGRFSKEYEVTREFVIAAVSNPKQAHQSRTIAWLKTLKLDEKSRMPAQALPFFPPRQAFTLSGNNSSADLSNLDNLDSDPEVVPADAGLRPHLFNEFAHVNPPRPHTLLEAIALLVNKQEGDGHGDKHGADGQHGHGDDAHGAGSGHGTDHGQEEHGAGQRQHDAISDHSDPHQTLHAPVAKSHDQHPPAAPVAQDAHKVHRPAPVPAAPVAETPASQTAFVPPFPHSTIQAEWVDQEDAESVVKFTESKFSMHIMDQELNSGGYALDLSKTPHAITITKADGSVIPAIFQFEDEDTIRLMVGVRGEFTADSSTYERKTPH